MTIKAGDKFVYKSKYGGVVKGEIKEIIPVICVDHEYKAYMHCYQIKSTNGVVYSLDEIRLVKSFMTDKEYNQWVAVTNFIKNMSKNAKERFSKKKLRKKLKNIQNEYRTSKKNSQKP